MRYAIAICLLAITLFANNQDATVPVVSSHPDNSWVVVYTGQRMKKRVEVIEAESFDVAVANFRNTHPNASIILSVSRRSYVDCNLIDTRNL